MPIFFATVKMLAFLAVILFFEKMQIYSNANKSHNLYAFTRESLKGKFMN